MNIYAFDVDDTLEISNGPVKISHLRILRDRGHVVGLCGNWVMFVQKEKDWPSLCNFLGPISTNKHTFLTIIKTSIPYYSKYIMVGNVERNVDGRSDRKDALMAGWEFIEAKDFEEQVIIYNK